MAAVAEFAPIVHLSHRSFHIHPCPYHTILPFFVQLLFFKQGLGLTQENIAEYLGVSTPAVSKWENGTTYPDITLLPGLARLLKTDLNTLMSFNEEMSEVEINNVVMKVQSIIQEDGFEDGFQFALDQVRAFPTCENLIYSLGVFLQPSLGLQSVEHQSKYREELAKLYFRIRNSENIEIKKEAISFLFYLHCEKEEYEKAATLLNDYPADTKLMMAYLHQQKKEYEPVCVLLEHRMLEIAVEMQSILIALTQVSLSENRGDDAEELACIQEQLAKQFGILECTAYTAKLECAINKKDAEYCTKILSLLLASMEGKTDISSNILYKHLNLSDDNMENLPRQLLSSMIEQLKFELYDETSFLKENPEFQSLLRRYREYLER